MAWIIAFQQSIVSRYFIIDVGVLCWTYYSCWLYFYLEHPLPPCFCPHPQQKRLEISYNTISTTVRARHSAQGFQLTFPLILHSSCVRSAWVWGDWGSERSISPRVPKGDGKRRFGRLVHLTPVSMICPMILCSTCLKDSFLPCALGGNWMMPSSMWPVC